MTATTTAKATKKAAAKAPAKKPTARKAPAKKAAAPAPAAPAELKTTLKVLALDSIERDENQPREIFDEEKLQELADSIKEIGVQQAITVRYISRGKYRLISGERRWRASQMAGVTAIPAMVMHGLEGGSETLEGFTRSVAENLGRADMTPLEEARAFDKLVVKFGLTPEEVARRIGKSWNHVDNRLQLLKLVPAVQEALLKGHVPVGLAWYAAQISPANQNAFIARWSRGQFATIRDAEGFCQRVRAEEQDAASQSVMFVLAEDAPDPSKVDDTMFPELAEADIDRRERIISDRNKLVGKIGKLGAAGEILQEIASMDPDELALLLSGAHGGIPGNRMRIDHLRQVATKASQNLAKAATAATVRAGALRVAPGMEATTITEADAS
ncbi:ParB/RepB/Spo0J family partition protein [Streptomyces sp. NBC_01728]|uniref:ParB/RepB/Spo0J family partition protein n=1 Tax=unclassified Streptomyces TaxID=2593676 RepID=UPI00224FA400|nr:MULTISPECIES: ParB/RepB/Spo0J family partition protein [unclassified Streptomyces]MCX4458603.1 ParB/RepB/Spo0J family partition protein [Streptomyces sp. NBC_01719]MCX4497960.1 ParB/RepB/Spo0J family partition protein [Streptomyces sp. NBC_01728]